MRGGVGGSGCPRISDTSVRPCARNCRASCNTRFTAVGARLVVRSARGIEEPAGVGKTSEVFKTSEVCRARQLYRFFRLYAEARMRRSLAIRQERQNRETG